MCVLGDLHLWQFVNPNKLIACVESEDRQTILAIFVWLGHLVTQPRDDDCGGRKPSWLTLCQRPTWHTVNRKNSVHRSLSPLCQTRWLARGLRPPRRGGMYARMWQCGNVTL